jgi:AI-2 transport protein TqsA
MANWSETRKADPLITLAALVVVVAGFKAASALLVPAVFAAFLAIIGAPAVQWLRSHRVPRVVAVLTVILTLTGALAATAILVGNSLDSFAQAITGYQERFRSLMQGAIAWLQARGVEVEETRLIRALDPGVMMELAAKMFEGLLGLLSNAFLVLVLLMFILFETTGFGVKLASALGEEWQAAHVRKLMSQVQRYLGVKTLMGLVTAAIIGVWVTLLGVDFPWLWALLAFLFNYVPFVGQLFAATPPILLALVQVGTGRAIVLAGGYAVINVVLTSLEPMLMGRQLRLSPLVVFLSLAFWGFVWGPVGMLLAVPLTVILKLLMEGSERLRWVALLMDANPEAAPEEP